MKKKEDKEFRFKQFCVQHDESTMKVGTDAVLLGAWTDVQNTKRILEVGTGSGVIALMLAQRSNENAKIDALEIDKRSATQAEYNVKQSPWREKISIHNVSLQEWMPEEQYDLIVSNPPFFSKSLLPPDSIRSTARHSLSLSSMDLLRCSQALLATNGRLAVVLPYSEGLQFIDEAHTFKFHVSKQVSVFSRYGKPQERWLLEFSFHSRPRVISTLTLHSEGNGWSEEYRQLTRDFYLNL